MPMPRVRPSSGRMANRPATSSSSSSSSSSSFFGVHLIFTFSVLLLLLVLLVQLPTSLATALTVAPSSSLSSSSSNDPLFRVLHTSNNSDHHNATWTIQLQFVHEITSLVNPLTDGSVIVARLYSLDQQQQMPHPRADGSSAYHLLFYNVTYGQATAFIQVDLYANDRYPNTSLVPIVLLDPVDRGVLAAFNISVQDGGQYTLVGYTQPSDPIDLLTLKNVVELKDDYGMDLAAVRFVNVANNVTNVTILGVSNNCYRCVAQPIVALNATYRASGYIALDTTFAMNLEVVEMSAHNLTARLPHLAQHYADDLRVQYLHQNQEAIMNLIALHHDTHDKEGKPLTSAGVLTQFEYHFGEHGIYTVFIRDGEAKINNTMVATGVVADVQVTREADDPFIPIYVAIGVIVGLAIIWQAATWGYRFGTAAWEQHKNKREGIDGLEAMYGAGQPAKDTAKPESRASSRVNSLDAVRGFAISIMIFVNYGGGGYWFFNHSAWNGITVADLVFPWFIWIMGTSMAISFTSLEKKRTPKREMLYKIIRRTIILAGLGLFQNNGYEWQTWRIPGVLMRFAVAYFVVGLTALYVPLWPWRWTYRIYRRFASPVHHYDDLQRKRFATEGINFDEDTDKDDSISHNGSLIDPYEDEESCQNMMKDTWVYRLFGDILPFWIQWLVAFSILFVYFMITFFLEVPGCPTGYLGPGGIGDYGEHMNCTGGAAGYIDRQIFTNDHIYNSPTCQVLYLTGSYDPEGTLGNLTSIFMVFLGLQSGRTLMAWKGHKDRVVRWYLWSIVLGFIALGLCEAKQNGGFFPLNKNLWSPSFILATGAMAFFLLATFYLLIDVFRLWNGSPFRFIGMNPITIYLGHEILGGYMPFSWDPYGDITHRMMLAMNLTGMSMWCLIGYWMYIHDFFISI